MSGPRTRVWAIALIALVPAALLAWFVVFGGDDGEGPTTDGPPGPTAGLPSAEPPRTTGPGPVGPSTPVRPIPTLGPIAPLPPVGPPPADAFVATLGGRVVDPAGQPVSGVVVRIIRLPAGVPARLFGFLRDLEPEATSRTGDDGEFSAEVSDAEAQYRVSVSHPPFAPFQRTCGVHGFPDDTRLGDLTLAPGATVAGRCVDRAGRGIAGIRVTATHGDAPAMRAMGAAGVTDSDGRFRMEGCPVGEVTVTAGGDRWALARAKPTLAPGEVTDDVRLELVPAMKIDGDVVDATGRSLGGVQVFATRLDSAGNATGAIADATTGADGRFVIEGLVDGRYRVQAWRHGNLSVEKMTAAGARGVRLRLDRVRPVTLAGEVAELGTGSAISGASVTVEARASLDGPTVLASAVSDGDGRFAVQLDRGRGHYIARVEADGYAPGASAPFTLEPNPPTSIRILMDRGAGLGGVVVDAHTRRAVEGAAVFLRPARAGQVGSIIGLSDLAASPAAARARSDQAGRFRFERLRSGKFDVEVRRSGYAPTWVRTITLVAGVTPSDLSVALGRGGGFVGRVAFTDGKAAAGVTVDLRSRTDSVEAVTDARGVARFEHLAPGRYAISVRPAGAPRSPFAGAPPRDAVSITVSEGSVVERQFSLPRGVRLSGIVREGGRPFAGAQIALRARDPRSPNARRQATREVRSDKSGAFSVPDVVPGAYRVHVRVQLGRESYIAVDRPLDVPRANEHRIEIEMPLGTLSGVVVVPTGTPRGVLPRIRIRHLDARPPISRGRIVEKDGTFAFRHLEPGRYELMVHSGPGWTGSIRGPLRLGAGGTLRGVEIRLERGVSVRGRVVDRGGEGVAAARVQLIPRTEDGQNPSTPPRTSRTQRSGEFVIEHVAPGRYLLRAGRREWKSTTREVVVPAGSGLRGQEIVLEQSR